MRRTKNAKQRILEALVEAYNIPIFWYSAQLPAGWLTTGHLCRPEVGGNSAPRRIREMRAAGIDIEIKTFSATNRLNEKVTCWIYRLKTPAKEINFVKGTLKNQKKDLAA